MYIENSKNIGVVHTNFMGSRQAMLLVHISYAIPCHWRHFGLQTASGVIFLLLTSKEKNKHLEWITKSKEGMSHEIK